MLGFFFVILLLKSIYFEKFSSTNILLDKVGLLCKKTLTSNFPLEICFCIIDLNKNSSKLVSKLCLNVMSKKRLFTDLISISKLDVESIFFEICHIRSCFLSYLFS